MPGSDSTVPDGTVSYITDEMRAAVGAIIDWRVSFPVSPSDVRRWAIATYYPEPPPSRFTGSDPATPEEFNPFAWAVADRRVPVVTPELRDTDKPEKTHGVTGPGLRFQVAAGLEVAYGVPMCAGDVIRSDLRLVEYSEKTGRLGLMLFTVTDDEWTNQAGERVKTIRETSIRYGR